MLSIKGVNLCGVPLLQACKLLERLKSPLDNDNLRKILFITPEFDDNREEIISTLAILKTSTLHATYQTQIIM